MRPIVIKDGNDELVRIVNDGRGIIVLGESVLRPKKWHVNKATCESPCDGLLFDSRCKSLTGENIAKFRVKGTGHLVRWIGDADTGVGYWDIANEAA